MADLAHDRNRVLAERNQHRGEGVAQLVGGHAFRQRHPASMLQDLIGTLEERYQHPFAQVVRTATGASQ